MNHYKKKFNRQFQDKNSFLSETNIDHYSEAMLAKDVTLVIAFLLRSHYLFIFVMTWFARCARSKKILIAVAPALFVHARLFIGIFRIFFLYRVTKKNIPRKKWNEIISYIVKKVLYSGEVAEIYQQHFSIWYMKIAWLVISQSPKL